MKRLKSLVEDSTAARTAASASNDLLDARINSVSFKCADLCRRLHTQAVSVTSATDKILSSYLSASSLGSSTSQSSNDFRYKRMEDEINSLQIQFRDMLFRERGRLKAEERDLQDRVSLEREALSAAMREAKELSSSIEKLRRNSSSSHHMKPQLRPLPPVVYAHKDSVHPEPQSSKLQSNNIALTQFKYDGEMNSAISYDTDEPFYSDIGDVASSSGAHGRSENEEYYSNQVSAYAQYKKNTCTILLLRQLNNVYCFYKRLRAGLSFVCYCLCDSILAGRQLCCSHHDSSKTNHHADLGIRYFQCGTAATTAREETSTAAPKSVVFECKKAA